MAVKKKRPRKKTPKRFRFQLGYSGVAGIAVVTFCLFLWMFLLGVWAGQTILLPSAPGTAAGKRKPAVTHKRVNLPVLRAEGRKRTPSR